MIETPIIDMVVYSIYYIDTIVYSICAIKILMYILYTICSLLYFCLVLQLKFTYSDFAFRVSA